MDMLVAAVNAKLDKILRCLIIIVSTKDKVKFFLMIFYVSTYLFYFVLEI